MIQPKELRIGNYVFDIDGDILQIGEILDVGVRFKNTSLASRYEKINPIPLTEEILLKFGFYFEEGFYCLRINNTAFMTIILQWPYYNFRIWQKNDNDKFLGLLFVVL